MELAPKIFMPSSELPAKRATGETLELHDATARPHRDRVERRLQRPIG